MIDKYWKYISHCFRDIPTNVSVGMLLVFCLGTISLFAFGGFKRGLKWSIRLLLLEYLFLILSLTVLCRPGLAVRRFDCIPFWSYRVVLEGGHDLLLTQIIMNVVAFIPLGFLLGCSFGNMKWWRVALCAAGFSLLIETLQFVTKRGFAEFDDVFHNVVGAMIGYGVSVGMAWVRRRFFHSSFGCSGDKC